MLFSTSQDSIKKALSYVAKLPFSKRLLHKLSEKARGHCVVYFSLHRLLNENAANLNHPHYRDQTAITPKQAHKLLKHIHQRLPFISLIQSLDYLKGIQKMNRSHAVLLVEVPYVQTMRLLNPILEELRIPATFVLDTQSIESGQMPWMDEISFRLGTTTQEEFMVTFIDRSFSLATPIARMDAAHHVIDNLSHASPATLIMRMEELRKVLSETALPPMGERISTPEQLVKLAHNSLFSFACAGHLRLPLTLTTISDAHKEIISSKNQLSSMFENAFAPVFFYPTGSDKRHSKEIVRLLLDSGYQAGITRNFGVCRPGDNMFRLMRLPLSAYARSFEQFELQGLLDAIDEFLLVTLGQEREL